MARRTNLNPNLTLTMSAAKGAHPYPNPNPTPTPTPTQAHIISEGGVPLILRVMRVHEADDEVQKRG